MGNILLSEGAIIFYIVVIIGAFILYALDLINNELRERNLESLLFKKFEVDDIITTSAEGTFGFDPDAEDNFGSLFGRP